MTTNSKTKKWFVDLPVAAKLRVLIVASTFIALLVTGLSAATLISFKAPPGGGVPQRCLFLFHGQLCDQKRDRTV